MILLSLLFAIVLIPQTGPPKVTEIKDSDKRELIGSLLSGDSYSVEEFTLRIHKKENPYGSAGNDTGEITHSYFFVISDNDGYPRRSVFEVGAFYGPEIKEVRKESGLIEVDIEYYANFKKTVRTVFIRQHRISF
ncbi:hypothetical protein BFP97_12650 [Roseivirga sp. 4D4]|uniref:hypothetical protein n=1 Tax=Roseivirga sp. 4D4 TaxID=1889784 RepID=UPI0008530DA0|nr:hypothetical protein [Roseivirga sp. 4D4]OEK02315.1 hypothetical protein BFP97_12650 [Roseivirga sp. 4D4]